MQKRFLLPVFIMLSGILLLGNGVYHTSQLSEPIYSSKCDIQLIEHTECTKKYQRLEVVDNITVLWAPECVE